MNLPELLTYADISQLYDMADHYALPRTHSKNDLIRTLLSNMQRPQWWRERTQTMAHEERRFWQLLFFDSREMFNLEELLGKGRQALQGKEGNPRTFVAKSLKAGVLFPSVVRGDRSLFQVPRDVRKHVIQALKSQIVPKVACQEEPQVYRDEQTCLVSDLETFLDYVGKQDVRLTAESAIYRRDLQAILGQMLIQEKPIDKKQWRFGFGRRYHQYPDRFSLLYDYAYYRQHIAEDGPLLSLMTPLDRNDENREKVAEDLYNFWLRLYRKPVPALPLIVKWIYLLARSDWIRLRGLKSIVDEWLTPYYYMDKNSVFQLLVKMLTHLGVIRYAEDALQMTESGNVWVERSAGWDLSELEDRYTTTASEQNFFRNQQGNSEGTLNK